MPWLGFAQAVKIAGMRQDAQKANQSNKTKKQTFRKDADATATKEKEQKGERHQGEQKGKEEERKKEERKKEGRNKEGRKKEERSFLPSFLGSPIGPYLLPYLG